MGLESFYCAFCGIAPVHMGGHHLVLCVPFFLVGLTTFCAGFVFEGLEVHFVAALFDSPEDVFVGGRAVAFVLGAEWLD